MKDFSKMNGLEKTAVLLFGLGPTRSSEIVKNLDDDKLIRIGQLLSDWGKIDEDILEKVMTEYLEMHTSSDPMLRTSKSDVVSLLEASVDDERGQRILGSLDQPKVFTIWDKLTRLKPEMIVNHISNEHPQTIAVILGKIDTSVASRVISLLPEDTQLSVVLRMSKIETIPKELVTDIEDTIEANLAGMEGESGLTFDGMISVVDILKSLDKQVAKPILERLEEKDQELFSQVDRLLLVFEDLKDLSARDVQELLKHISTDDLVRSLKGASDECGEIFFGNMSQRAADIMKEDMSVMGPLKLADVEEAQMSILRVVRKLDDDGAITLGNSEDMI